MDLLEANVCIMSPIIESLIFDSQNTCIPTVSSSENWLLEIKKRKNKTLTLFYITNTRTSK